MKKTTYVPMKFRLYDLTETNTTEPLNDGIDPIEAIDASQAALQVLDLLRLRLVVDYNPEIRPAVIETLPNGRVNERNAAAYLGYSEITLKGFRRRSKGMNNGIQAEKKCPRYFKKMGRIEYRLEDLDRWMKTGDSARPTPAWLVRAREKSLVRLKGLVEKKKREASATTLG